MHHQDEPSHEYHGGKHHHEDCGCGHHGHRSHMGEQHHHEGCGCRGHHHGRGFGPGFERRFISKEEVIAQLEEYLKQLQAEAKGVEERIAELKKV